MLDRNPRSSYRDQRLAPVTSLGPSGFISSEFLVSPELARFSRRTVLADRRLSFHLQIDGGLINVGGGFFGRQTIEAMPVDTGLQSFYWSMLNRLDRLIDIDLHWSADEEADVRVYLDREISLVGSAQVLGLAVANAASPRPWWEIFLDNTALAYDQDYLRYALLHEHGHVLGLEHPFDIYDGDVYVSSNPALGAYPEDTVMAYRSPKYGHWPQWFSDNDIEAMVTLWGAKLQVYGDEDDVVIGESYSEKIGGGPGNDTLYGGLGYDTLLGGLGDDVLDGGPWADRLFGRFGNDTLFGGLGRDHLNGGQGDDFMRGDDGADLFVISAGIDQIEDYRPEEGDQIALWNWWTYSVSSSDQGLQIATQYGVTTLLQVYVQALDIAHSIVML